MRYVIAAVLASSMGIARADDVVVRHYTNNDIQEPEPFEPSVGAALAAQGIGGSLLIGGAFFYGMGDRSGWSAAAMWTSFPLLAIGPSIVHFVTGDYAVGGAGVGANLVAFTLCGLAIHHYDVLADRTPPDGHFDTGGKYEFYGGLALWAGASIFEIVDSLRVLRRRHERLQLTPTGAGVALSGQFLIVVERSHSMRYGACAPRCH